MNKHGQTLILFVILIPIIILLLAIIVDLGIVINKKIMVREVIEEVIKDKSDEKIKEVLIKNDIDVDKLDIIRNNNTVQVKIELNVKSIFGAIIGIKDYKIKVDITESIKE